VKASDTAAPTVRGGAPEVRSRKLAHPRADDEPHIGAPCELLQRRRHSGADAGPHPQRVVFRERSLGGERRRDERAEQKRSYMSKQKNRIKKERRRDVPELPRNVDKKVLAVRRSEAEV